MFSHSHLMIRVESLAGPVPVEAFLRAAGELSFVANEVGRHFVAAVEEPTGGMAKGWRIVDVQTMAPTAVLEGALPDERQRHAVALLLAPPFDQKGAPSRLRAGVRAIAEGCEERPDGFSDAALRALRRVAQTGGRKIRVTLSAGEGQGEALSLDEAFARHIDSWLGGKSASIGSVEGKLELISIHDRLRFTIYGRGGLRVECLFPETMLGQVKGALGERVCLRGRVRYRKDGKPATVEARHLKTMAAANRLPSLETMMEQMR